MTAPIAPNTIAALPTPPASTSPGDFDSRADAFLGALPTLQAQTNDASSATYTNALSANESAVAAANHAAVAQAASGATMWVPGNYAAGSVVWSPTNGLAYRAKLLVPSAIDPVSDPTNWWSLVPAATGVATSTISTTTTVPAGTRAAIYAVLTSGLTITLPVSPLPGDQITLLWRDAALGVGSTVARNGSAIESLAENMAINTPTRRTQYTYVDATRGWLLS